MNKKDKTKLPFLLHILIFVALIFTSMVFVIHTWKINIRETEKNAIELAEAAEAGIPKSYLTKLNDDFSYEGKEEYKELKQILSFIVKLDNDIRFSYIYIEKEGKIYFIADSEPIGSEDYSPPGQEYTEADYEMFLPYQNRDTILTEAAMDRWGEWVSVLVPMKDPENGKVLAVYGIDFPAATWNDDAIKRTIQSGLLSLSILIIYVILSYAFIQNKHLHNEKKKLVASEEKLKESETMFRSVFEQATIGIAIGNSDTYIVSNLNNRPSINSMFEKIIGRKKEELSGMKWPDITYPEDVQEDMEKFAQLKAGLIQNYELEKRYIKPDGSITWIHMLVSSLQIDNDNEFRHLCLVEDITKQKELEKTLFNSERSKSILLENLPGMAYRCNYDREWTMQYISGGCLELTGYNTDSIINNRDISFNEIILPKYREGLWEKWKTVLNEGTKLREEYEIITASGEIKWVYEQGQVIFGADNHIEALEGLIIDITQRKEQEMRFKYISEHDTLTGIYNKRYFETVLSIELQSNKKLKKALLSIHIKNFNLINITYGYYLSEKLIKEMADILSNFCNDNYQLFHISIDRFVILINEYKDQTDLSAICETILKLTQNLNSINDIQASIGIVELDGYVTDVDNILKFAAIAAEEASENKALEYCYFNQEMEDIIVYKEIIKEELTKSAVNENDENLFLLYQPIIDLKSDKIYGYEALARFESEKFGLISPTVFIPIAEETGLIVPLGLMIMRQALLYLKKLELLGYSNVIISINVSAIQILREDFIPNLKNIINETAINPNNINIELTESVFFNDYHEINLKLDQIKELGIKVSIDDFGTGYSSLARERELNINCLKIDKYFIDKLLILDEKDAISGDIISMAHKLGHFVVAEGVEIEEQKNYLIKHNCDYAQGFLFSEPLTPENAIKLLEQINLY